MQLSRHLSFHWSKEHYYKELGRQPGGGFEHTEQSRAYEYRSIGPSV